MNIRKYEISKPRKIAFEVLESTKNGAWSDSTLKKYFKKSDMSSRDCSLCSYICYGVQQNQRLLDYWIEQNSNVKLAKLESVVLNALRMAIYQIALMDKIPDNAAVNESVELVKQNSKNPNSYKLTNAILRSFCRSKNNLQYPSDLGIKYSHPDWIVNLFKTELNLTDNSEDLQELEKLLQADNSQPEITIQVNTVKTDVESLINELRFDRVKVSKHAWLKNCLKISETGNIEDLKAFREGKFIVQDVAARLVTEVANPKQNSKILDVCAAPGGKSFSTAIAMNNTGEIISCDVQAKKVKLIQENAKRLGLSCIKAQVCNGKDFKSEWEKAFDIVITDVPCSGLGIMRKKPDIRFKDEDSIKNLPQVQYDILSNASRYVKSNGLLVYSTCTVLRRENQDIVSKFLYEHPDFELESFVFDEFGINASMFTFWTHITNTDGFFIAKLHRK